MKQNNYIKLLTLLGVHIANPKKMISSDSFRYLIGYRHNYGVYNLGTDQLTDIQNAIKFFYYLGKNSGQVLLYSNFSSKDNSLEVSHPSIEYFFLHYASKNNNISFCYKPWSFGQLSNGITQYLDYFYTLFYLDAIEIPLLERKYKYDFISLFYSLLEYTMKKKVEGQSLSSTMELLQKYWRFYYYFRHYNFLKDYPDALISLSNSNIKAPLVESMNRYIPSFSIAGSQTAGYDYCYLVPANNKNLIFSLFFGISLITYYKLGLRAKYLEMNRK